MKLFYTSILLFCTIFIFSQERKTIKGKVYLNEFQEWVSGIYVKNTNTNYTTITDITGNFTIQAKEGDAILFQAYNIEKRTVILTPSMQQKGAMIIHLNIKEKDIEEVYITPFKTYGSLELDVKRIPMMNQTNALLAKLGDLYPKIKMDGSTDIESETAKLSTMKIDIDGIFDLFSGNNKKRERLAAYEDQIHIIKNIREYFGDEYFEGIGLSENEIDEFILYTYLNHDVKFFYNYNNYFQILNVFEKNVQNYKTRKQGSTAPLPKVGEKYFSD